MRHETEPSRGKAGRREIRLSRERGEVAPRDLEAAAPGAPDGLANAAHLRGEARGSASSHDRRQSDEREKQRHRDEPGPDARGATRPAQERGGGREAHERQGERQRAHVQGRLGRDRRPARGGEDHEGQRGGERHAHDDGQQAQQARAF